MQSVYSFVKYVTHDLAKYADQKTSRIAFVAIETDVLLYPVSLSVCNASGAWDDPVAF